jgi:hypothetical protein
MYHIIVPQHTYIIETALEKESLMASHAAHTEHVTAGSMNVSPTKVTPRFRFDIFLSAILCMVLLGMLLGVNHYRQTATQPALKVPDQTIVETQQPTVATDTLPSVTSDEPVPTMSPIDGEVGIERSVQKADLAVSVGGVTTVHKNTKDITMRLESEPHPMAGYVLSDHVARFMERFRAQYQRDNCTIVMTRMNDVAIELSLAYCAKSPAEEVRHDLALMDEECRIHVKKTSHGTYKIFPDPVWYNAYVDSGVRC